MLYACITTLLRQGGYVIVVVCLLVCLPLATFAHKTSDRICMKFSVKVGNGPVNKWLNFGGSYQCRDTDPDHGSGSVSGHWYDVPWRRYALSQWFKFLLISWLRPA